MNCKERNIVLVRFPYSDLTGNKRRPALVLAQAGLGDWILCQITTKYKSNMLCIDSTDLSLGSLNRKSYICPTKLTTVNEILLESSDIIDILSENKFSQVIQVLRSTFCLTENCQMFTFGER